MNLKNTPFDKCPICIAVVPRICTAAANHPAITPLPQRIGFNDHRHLQLQHSPGAKPTTTTTTMPTPRILNVGLIGNGEAAQVLHLPVLSHLTHLYRILSTCDISATTASHCATKHHIPHHTTNPAALLSNPAIDIVFILTSDEHHEPLTIAALEAGKSVLLEKPMTLSLASADRILAAERRAAGPRVFVGYMRRYACSFTGAFAREVAGIDRILYARARDFSGPNAFFVEASGTFPVRNTHDIPASAGREATKLMDNLLAEAWRGRGEVTPERRKLARFLNTLGSHDISLMREVLGMPVSVGGVSANDPFYSAILNFRRLDGHAFSCTYESGIDAVPEFDAHLAVYGEHKRVSIEYDSPYVKGLGIKVVVVEVNGFGEIQRREMLTSYEDAYTTELCELYDCIINDKPFKTSAEDARNELVVYDMIYDKFDESH